MKYMIFKLKLVSWVHMKIDFRWSIDLVCNKRYIYKREVGYQLPFNFTKNRSYEEKKNKN